MNARQSATILLVHCMLLLPSSYLFISPRRRAYIFKVFFYETTILHIFTDTTIMRTNIELIKEKDFRNRQEMIGIPGR
jgi:hypothetical protein